MAAAAPEQGAAFPLLELPPGVAGCIANQLDVSGRVCLAATCRTMRAASLHWFRHDVVALEVDDPEPPFEHLTWLRRVQAPVHLTLGDSLHMLSAFALGGVRVAEISLSKYRGSTLQRVPAQLSCLTQLTALSLRGNGPIQGGWRHLPPLSHSLRLLSVGKCGLLQLPAQLQTLSRLWLLELGRNPIESGWKFVPLQLRELRLNDCGLLRVPAELAGMSQLRSLQLGGNRITSGWQYLPQTLAQLNLHNCGLRQVPALAETTPQLWQLTLAANRIDSGNWSGLPAQLQALYLGRCGLQQVPMLPAMTQLATLSLAGNRISGGWQRLPQTLMELNLDKCGLQQVPALASLTRLSRLSLCGNVGIDGGEGLPPQLQLLILHGCRLQQLPAALAGRRLAIAGFSPDAQA